MPEEPEGSPTTSIGRAFVAIGTAFLIAAIVGAPGLVHAGMGMADGPERTATLALGQATVRLAQAAHLDWPWRGLSIALGHPEQPDVPPLLASASTTKVGDAPRASTMEDPSAAPTSLAVAREPATPTPADSRAQPCRLVLGFAAIAALIPDQVGACTSDEQHDPVTGDAYQRTARGLLVWRKADNWTAFTDGYWTWVNGPQGIAKRLNSQRFSWEANPEGLQVMEDPKAPVPTPASTPPPPPTAVPTPQVRAPTREQPLRLLVTGDSLTGYLGPLLVDAAAAEGPVRGMVDTHNGTGLTRPDFVDWSLVAKAQVTKDDPDAVVVMMGGNDFQNMVVPGGSVLVAGTPAWTEEYQRRVGICMRIWSQGGSRRVYWLSIPPARNPQWATDDGQINAAVQRAAAQVPGAKYLDIVGLVTDHGAYSDVITTNAGERLLIREPDGVHLNLAGSKIVAQHVLQVISSEWHVG